MDSPNTVPPQERSGWASLFQYPQPHSSSRVAQVQSVSAAKQKAEADEAALKERKRQKRIAKKEKRLEAQAARGELGAPAPPTHQKMKASRTVLMCDLLADLPAGASVRTAEVQPPAKSASFVRKDVSFAEIANRTPLPVQPLPAVTPAQPAATPSPLPELVQWPTLDMARPVARPTSSARPSSAVKAPTKRNTPAPKKAVIHIALTKKIIKPAAAKVAKKEAKMSTAIRTSLVARKPRKLTRFRRNVMSTRWLRDIETRLAALREIFLTLKGVSDTNKAWLTESEHEDDGECEIPKVPGMPYLSWVLKQHGCDKMRSLCRLFLPAKTPNQEHKSCVDKKLAKCVLLAKTNSFPMWAGLEQLLGLSELDSTSVTPMLQSVARLAKSYLQLQKTHLVLDQIMRYSGIVPPRPDHIAAVRAGVEELGESKPSLPDELFLVSWAGAREALMGSAGELWRAAGRANPFTAVKSSGGSIPKAATNGQPNGNAGPESQLSRASKVDLGKAKGKDKGKAREVGNSDGLEKGPEAAGKGQGRGPARKGKENSEAKVETAPSADEQDAASQTPEPPRTAEDIALDMLFANAPLVTVPFECIVNPELIDRRSNAVHRNPTSKPLRSYVFAELNDETDALVIELLTSLNFYQKRLKKENALKFKSQMRYVQGMKQSQKGISSKRAKMLLIVPNTEYCEVMDVQIQRLLSTARQNQIPVVFCLNLRRLGHCVSTDRCACVCIYSADGAYEVFSRLRARAAANAEAFLEVHPERRIVPTPVVPPPPEPEPEVTRAQAPLVPLTIISRKAKRELARQSNANSVE